MKLAGSAAVLALVPALALAAAPAAACLPPPPGIPEPPPPTLAERALSIYRVSTDIVYGVVTGYKDGTPRFKVLHVYKGNLKPGALIAAETSHGFDFVGCLSGPPPPAFKGEYGVIAFHGEPRLDYLSDDKLEAMFDAGWIARARSRKGRPE
jgi:hypothetical protein